MNREPTIKEVQMLEYLMKPKGVEGFWQDVDTFMKYLYEMYPEDMKNLELYAQVKRESAFNKWSSNEAKTQRILVAMPDMLDMMLKKVYNGQFPVTAKQFKKGFYQRYPKLRVADTI